MRAAEALPRRCASHPALASSQPKELEASPDIKVFRDPAEYAIKGIDVSQHNGVIDWRLVAASGIDFAYIRATQGRTVADRSFAKNWAEAEAAGLRRGAYHFYNWCASAMEQIANFTKVVPVDPDALPPIIDLERYYSPEGDCFATMDQAQAKLEVRTFLIELESLSKTAGHIQRRQCVSRLYRR